MKITLQNCVPIYLICSYLYYIKNEETTLEDWQYDKLARMMLVRWDEIKHKHKHLVTKNDLSSGTLYNLKEENYPLIVREASRLFKQRVR